MADDPNRARNIERVRRAKKRQRTRRAIKPTRPNQGRRVGPPASRPVGGRRVGPPGGRRELQPIAPLRRAAPSGRRELQPIAAPRPVTLAASRAPTATRSRPAAAGPTAAPRSVPLPPGIQKRVAAGKGLPPGIAKREAGLQSASSLTRSATKAQRASGSTALRKGVRRG